MDAITAGAIIIDTDATAQAIGATGALALTSTDSSIGPTEGAGQAESFARGDLAASSTTGALGGIDGGVSDPDLLVLTGASAEAFGSDATTTTRSSVYVRDGRIADVGVARSKSAATGLAPNAAAFADGSASGNRVITRRTSFHSPDGSIAGAVVVVISISVPDALSGGSGFRGLRGRFSAR